MFNNDLVEGDPAMTVTAEWEADGIAPLDPAWNRRLPYADGYHRWAELLAGGGDVHGLTREFPVSERAGLEADEVRSLAIVPVVVGDTWWGFLGFDDCVDERVWSEAELEALRAASDTLGAAIGRADAEARRRDAEERYRTLVETIPAVTYMQGPGMDDHVFYVSPQVERVLGYTPEEWIDAGARRLATQTCIPTTGERGWRGSTERTGETGEPFLAEYRSEAQGRALRVDPRRGRARPRRPTGAAVLAGDHVRHHRRARGRAAGPRRRTSLPRARRAHPGGPVHRSDPRGGPHDLREPARRARCSGSRPTST